MDVFSKYAPKYWEKGISVTPLLERSKKPFLPDWNRYHDHLPDEATRQQWLETFTNNNIGLILGEQSGVTVIDIDTDDPGLIHALTTVLPPSPWVRVGMKGMVMAFKYSGIRTFRIRTKENKTIVEYLSKGTQVVLPPSIHPDTGLPYVANCELYDVIDQLPALPDNIEDKLRAILSTVIDLDVNKTGASKFKLTEKIPQGGRDIKMNQFAGYQAHAVMKAELSVKEALGQMSTWVESYVERVAGDELDIQKGYQQIIQYILREVNEKGRILPPGWDLELSDDEKKSWGLIFDVDQEEWTCDQMIEYINNCYSTTPDDDPKRHQCIDFCVNKLSKSLKLSTLEIERILISLKSGTKYTVAVLKRRLKELQAGPIQGLNHTEIAEATIKELEAKGYIVKYSNSQIWNWEGTHWIPLDEGDIWTMIAREFGSLPAATRANDHVGIIKVMGKLIPKEIQLVDIKGVNFRNGFLTSDLKLLPHNKDFGMTYMLPYNYDPNQAGRAYRFEAFLHDCWSHTDDFVQKKLLLQELICITLFGLGPSYQVAVLLHGVGGSGKSQLLELIQNLVPQEAQSGLPPDSWGNTHNLAFLDKKILNVAGELDKLKLIPGAAFKGIVDGSQQTAQHKFKDPFNFYPVAMHWCASNFLPRSNDTSNGFNRRWRILDFDKATPDHKKITDLGKIIVREEAEAIIAWAVEALPDLQFRGSPVQPPSHMLLQHQMGLQNSTIRQWLGEKVIEQPGNRLKEYDLYMDFQAYAIIRGGGSARVCKQKDFILELKQFLSEQGRGNFLVVEGEIVFLDIGLKKK